MSYVDLAFSLLGSDVPIDHGYALFSAIQRIVPEVHGNRTVGIHPIRGQSSGKGTFLIEPSSHLTVRTGADEIKTFLPLAGKRIEICGHSLQVGTPKVFLLAPAANLHARLVTIKGFMEEAAFREALQRQLEELNVSPREIQIGPKKRTLQIQDKRVVGFSVRLLGLTADDSLTIQEVGLGGRRRFGCGVFVRLR